MQKSWGNKSNRAVVRFNGQDSQGLLGRGADVRIVLPPSDKEENVAGALLDTLTGHGEDEVHWRSPSSGTSAPATPAAVKIGKKRALTGRRCT